MTATDIAPFNPTEAVALARMMKAVVTEIRREVLKEGVDYGAIPGTDKPVLLKPGAERLCTAFKLYPVFSVVSQIEDWERGIFFYRYECALIHRETGQCYGRGIGSCNSQEGKYGWRWVAQDRVPSHLDLSTLATRNGSFTEFEFAIDKAETTGKYGKPAEYWQAFKDAIANHTAVKGEKKNARGMATTWSIGGTEYRIPNIDVFDLVNTIDKMGQKRSLIAATLIATNASEYFNQDLEDFDPTVFGIKTPIITVETNTPAITQNAANSPSEGKQGQASGTSDAQFWERLKARFFESMNNKNAERAIDKMRDMYRKKEIDTSMSEFDVFQAVIVSGVFVDGELMEDDKAVAYFERIAKGVR